MLLDVHGRIAIPQHLTYALGFSMGGGLVYRLLCEASDVISGFGVACQPGPYSDDYQIYLGTAKGSSWAAQCRPTIARPLWVVSGTGDRFFTTANTSLGWEGMARQALGCQGAPLLEPAPNETTSLLLTVHWSESHSRVRGVTCQRFDQCSGNAIARHCVYTGMGHEYPSGAAEAAGLASAVATPLDATPAGWAFWQAVTTPPSAPPSSLEAGSVDLAGSGAMLDLEGSGAASGAVGVVDHVE